MRSPDLAALSLRVEKAELELRLLNAMIRIQTAQRDLAALRVRTEESIGIYRGREGVLSADAP